MSSYDVIRDAFMQGAQEIDRLRKENEKLLQQLISWHPDKPPFLVVKDGRIIPLLDDEAEYIIHWLATGSKKGTES